MGLLGVTNGLTNVLLSSLWAEIYGVNYLGSIKALTGALMVFSTALATAVFGILIDSGYSIENIAIIQETLYKRIGPVDMNILAAYLKDMYNAYVERNPYIFEQIALHEHIILIGDNYSN